MSGSSRFFYLLVIFLFGSKLQVFLHVVDVSNTQAVRAFAERFLSQNNKVDVLVNNAGILAVDRRLSPDGIEETLAVALGALQHFTAVYFVFP